METGSAEVLGGGPKDGREPGNAGNTVGEHQEGQGAFSIFTRVIDLQS